MEPDQEKLRGKIQELLGKEITHFSIKGKGAVNYAYYIQTNDGVKYIVKQERESKDFQPQNSLIIEAKVAKLLYDTKLTVPIPHVVFISEDSAMYCYEYIEGDLMRTVWQSLLEEDRIRICSKLGNFHAEIGKKISRATANRLGVRIIMSPNLHPETEIECNEILVAVDTPDGIKDLAKRARAIFDQTLDKTVFQFLHNDSHHENIIIKDKKISGIIDFGNSEYGDVVKEFSRYIRDFPSYFKYIVSSYEKESGKTLSYERLISYAVLSGLMEIVEGYKKGGEERTVAEETIATYTKLIYQL